MAYQIVLLRAHVEVCLARSDGRLDLKQPLQRPLRDFEPVRLPFFKFVSDDLRLEEGPEHILLVGVRDVCCLLAAPLRDVPVLFMSLNQVSDFALPIVEAE